MCCRWQVNVGLTTYRGPGQDDASLGQRFRDEEKDESGYEDEDEDEHDGADKDDDEQSNDDEQSDDDEEVPPMVTSVLGKRVREDKEEFEDEERDEDADQD